MREELDPCSRCLVILDTRTSVVARHRDGRTEPFATVPTAMRPLLRWVEEKLATGWVIDVDNWTRAFDPISTWHGDPVCEIHLIECREREWRRH